MNAFEVERNFTRLTFFVEERVEDGRRSNFFFQVEPPVYYFARIDSFKSCASTIVEVKIFKRFVVYFSLKSDRLKSFRRAKVGNIFGIADCCRYRVPMFFYAECSKESIRDNSYTNRLKNKSCSLIFPIFTSCILHSTNRRFL